MANAGDVLAGVFHHQAEVLGCKLVGEVYGILNRGNQHQHPAGPEAFHGNGPAF